MDNTQESNQKKHELRNAPIPGALGTGSMMPGSASSMPAEQKGGFFLTDDGSLSWGSIIYGIIHFVLAWFAIYTVYTNGGGIGWYLLSCCCPYVYLIYFFGSKYLSGKGSVGKSGAKIQTGKGYGGAKFRR